MQVSKMFGDRLKTKKYLPIIEQIWFSVFLHFPFSIFNFALVLTSFFVFFVYFAVNNPNEI